MSDLLGAPVPDPLDAVRTYQANGGSLRELARLAGVPHNTLANWLRADRGTPRPIIQAFKVLAALKGLRRRKTKG